MKVGPGSGEGVPVRGDETSHPNHPQGANPSAGWVGPDSAIVGIPQASATCSSPESFVTASAPTDSPLPAGRRPPRKKPRHSSPPKTKPGV